MTQPTTAPSSSGRLPLTIVLIAALAAGLGLWAGKHVFFDRPTLPETQTMRLLDPPRVLPEFSLQSAAHTRIDATTLHGRWTMLFLGFTHCPDICPTTLAELAKVEKLLSDVPESQRPRILFVSVDPERDTPEILAKYAAYFSPTVLAGTSDLDSLTRLAGSLSMVFAKTPLADGDYTIDHTSWVAVLDPEARLAGFIRPPLEPEKIAADLRLLVESR
ncbi:SCO family protein [Xanthomonadaceae bacterium JHOS43]|nr:SCO family protein [Xanthomonadaceae bacterium JHOS43]